jgi:uncharacterized protein YdeI (YjbR/CyaY-like superfamily)
VTGARADGDCYRIEAMPETPTDSIHPKSALADERSMLWFAPRKKGSAWSKNNKERIGQLLRANLMHASGLAKIEEAKQDGSWAKVDRVEALEIPPDLGKAFKAHPGAQGHFDAFPRSSKRAILEWIGNAKTEVTRAKRVAETAALAAGNVRANQWVRKQ